jgi:hypothetical protein
MIFGNVLDKSLIAWKAFQCKKGHPIYVEDIAIKIDFIDPLDEDVIFWPQPGGGQ